MSQYDFDALQGQWHLARSIPQHADMTGTATFTRSAADTLHYSERGRLRLVGGAEHTAYRSYVFRRTHRGFEVYFDESPPRLFHAVRLRQERHVTVGTATHWCAPDAYDSTYRFISRDRFAIEHVVVGPRKRYTSLTVFERLPSA